MASLSQAKTLGGVGAILALLFPVPTVGWILSIAGFILILVAVKNIADTVGEPSIFNDMIISVVLAIVGIVVGVVVLFGALFSIIGLGGPSFMFTPGTPPSGDIIAIIGAVILGLVVIWIFFLVAAIFLKRSYDKIGTRLNVGMFRTTGLLYLIGAATTIILIGFLIVLIADILQIVAFFSIPDQPPQQPTAQQTWPQPPAPQA